jgi:hypothetical protein
VLVVGVSRSRGSDSRLVRGLKEHLVRSGLLVAESSLSAQDRACDSADCIEELASREGAQLVLTAKLRESDPGGYFVTMALFDAVRRAPYQETALCEQCNPDALQEKLSDLSDKLLKQNREARRSPVPLASPPIVPTVPLVVASDPVAGAVVVGSRSVPASSGPGGGASVFVVKLTPRRKLAAGILGGLAGAGLVAAVVLTALDGQVTGRPCMMSTGTHGCALDTVGAYSAAYAVSGALAIGVGLTLFWPEKLGKPASSEVR